MSSSFSLYFRYHVIDIDFRLILPDRLQHRRAGESLGLTWQTSGPSLFSAILPNPVLLSVQAQGDVFGDDPSPPRVLNLFCQWCCGKLKTPWIPFPSTAETRKPAENPIAFSSVVSWVAPQWLDANRLMLTCQLIYPGWKHCLCCVLCSGTHLHVQLRLLRLHPIFLITQNHSSVVGFSETEFSCPSEKCRRNCNTYGAKSVLLYAFSTSHFLHEMLSNFAVWILVCNLYWISQCS